MIQRIQSIYLLLASIASAAVFKLPFASSFQSEAQSMLFSDGTYNAYDNLALEMVFALISALAVVTIFYFKNRKLQMKLSLLGVLISCIALGLMVFFFIEDSWAMGNIQNIKDQFGLGMPVFSLLFFLIARYNIKKDDKKVQSMDRLR